MEKYSIIEIVDMTIEKEEIRRDFYSEAAKRFNRQKMKDLFRELSEWESIHIEKVNKLKEKLNEPKMIDSSLGELKAYLRSVVDSKLYNTTSMGDFVASIANENDAIDQAISFEKDAVLFFSEFLELSLFGEIGLIEQLRDEEKKHIVYLMQLKEEFGKE